MTNRKGFYDEYRAGLPNSRKVISPADSSREPEPYVEKPKKYRSQKQAAKELRAIIDMLYGIDLYESLSGEVMGQLQGIHDLLIKPANPPKPVEPPPTDYQRLRELTGPIIMKDLLTYFKQQLELFEQVASKDGGLFTLQDELDWSYAHALSAVLKHFVFERLDGVPE